MPFLVKFAVHSFNTLHRLAWASWNYFDNVWRHPFNLAVPFFYTDLDSNASTRSLVSSSSSVCNFNYIFSGFYQFFCLFELLQRFEFAFQPKATLSSTVNAFCPWADFYAFFIFEKVFDIKKCFFFCTFTVRVLVWVFQFDQFLAATWFALLFLTAKINQLFFLSSSLSVFRF